MSAFSTTFIPNASLARGVQITPTFKSMSDEYTTSPVPPAPPNGPGAAAEGRPLRGGPALSAGRGGVASPHSPPAAILAAAASLPLPPSKQGKREGSGGTGQTGRQTGKKTDGRTTTAAVEGLMWPERRRQRGPSPG